MWSCVQIKNLRDHLEDIYNEENYMITEVMW